jgi:monoamine oxidase
VSNEVEQGQVVDVAIVGGGVSGLYSAWRLKQRQRNARIVVYECSDYRTGGRLMSAIPPGMPHVPAELGGMRFLNTQPIVQALADHLHVAYRDFPVSESNNIAYLRGSRLRRSELTDPAKLPYRLSPAERGKSIGELMDTAMETIVPGITADGLTPEQRRALAQRTTFLGRPLTAWGFWNALARVMTFEAYQFVADGSGYDTTVSNWNAADAIPWFLADFGKTAVYKNPLQGMQVFPDRLRELFEVELEGDVRLGHTVRRIARSGRHLVLEFKPSDPPIEPVIAKRVILAMPRRSLELIDLEPALGNEMSRVRTLIESVSPQPLFKFFACYRTPWWREEPLGVRQGQTTTDIPIRQVYYFGTEGEQPGGEPGNTNSLMMASYDDGRNIRYWIGFLREMEAASRFATSTTDAGDEQWQRNQPPETMVEEVQRLIAEVHGLPLEQVPKPYAAAYHDWGIDPFGGGYNLWKIHAESPRVIDAIIQPVAEIPLFVCGEAYSNAQGWVEGALETAELMLKRGFQLDAPEWLPQQGAAGQLDMTTESATLRF